MVDLIAQEYNNMEDWEITEQSKRAMRLYGFEITAYEPQLEITHIDGESKACGFAARILISHFLGC